MFISSDVADICSEMSFITDMDSLHDPMTKRLFIADIPMVPNNADLSHCTVLVYRNA